MKIYFKAMIAVLTIAFIASACSVSFSTANISSFNFGKDEKTTPPTTNFNVGEKVFAVATVSNAMGKHKMKYKITPPGGTPVDKDLDFEGSRPITYSFNPTVPGEYKFDVSLMDDTGKEIDKKSGSITVKGDAAPPSDKPKSDTGDGDDERDDKPAN